MKKFFSRFFLILSLIILFTSSNYLFTVHKFNHNDVINTINELCSNTYNGRLAGTVENDMTAEYVKRQFIDNNLAPLDADYFQYFSTPCPVRVDGMPYLKITDSNGRTIKEYIYSIDYKEDMLNFRTNNFSCVKKNILGASEDSLQLSQGDNSFLIYTSDNDSLNFRSSFICDSKCSMYIIATKKTLEDVKIYINKGYTVKCFIPYTTKEKQLKNVTAYIKGSNPLLCPMVISAHFDHMGSDILGNVYRGALDNASGISYLMELSKYINTLGTPERDIIIVGFNAEEFGCKGSESFVNKYCALLKGGDELNFDMVGSSLSSPIDIMGGKNDTVENSELIRTASQICKDKNAYFNYSFEDASDHEFFRKNGISAITFCDNDISRIHTTNDIPKYIDTKGIDRCFNISSYEIINNCFKNAFLILYYKQISIISLICTLFLSVILVKENRKV